MSASHRSQLFRFSLRKPFLLLLVLCVSCVLRYIWFKFAEFNEAQYQVTEASSLRLVCPDVLQNMTIGQWLPEDVSAEHRLSTRLFYKEARKIYGIPSTLERNDLRCGDVNFNQNSIFRALCNADGQTPCCWQGKCTNRSMSECNCTGCLDMRTRLFADDSVWVPSEPSCSIDKGMYETPNQVFSTLYNTSILFVGDSLMRQLYMTFLWMTSGDWDFGSMKANVSKDIKMSCSGRNMFIEKTCRFYLDRERRACNRTTVLQYLAIWKVDIPNATATIDQYMSALPSWSERMLVFGIGLHDNFNFAKIRRQFLNPLLEKINCVSGAKCPQLVWVSTHSPGPLKSLKFTGQQAKNTAIFSAQMKKFLNETKVSFFDPFNITRHVHTIDGTHAALSVNLVKAKILLSFIDRYRLNHGSLVDV